MSIDLSAMFGLQGKTAVITGGGGDLCSALALAISGAGARVAILDIRLDKAQAVAAAVTDAGGTAAAHACDVLDEKSLRSVCDAIGASWGIPDILLNGAGGNVPSGSTKLGLPGPVPARRCGRARFLRSRVSRARKTFDLNFLGTFLPTRVFAHGMVERGSGCILNIASMGALTPLTQVGAYSAAKAAVANFTAWLAVHFARAGVRVNTIAPGLFF